MGAIFFFSNQPSAESLNSSGQALVHLKQLEKEDIQNINNRDIWNQHYQIRKLAHFIIYFVLGALILFTYLPINKSMIKALMIPWSLSAFYAILDELHQNFIPGRGATIADIKLDSVSAFCGVCITLLTLKYSQRFIEFY